MGFSSCGRRVWLRVVIACAAAGEREHREHEYRAVTVGDNLEAGSTDGSLIRVQDSAANRAAFGSAGTADDSSPYPQLRELRISGASTRFTLGVVTSPRGPAAPGTRARPSRRCWTRP